MNKYERNTILKIAKRYNNSKRPYLLVNPLQAKHIPTKPEDALNMMQVLGDKVSNKYPNSKVVIAFAETATAIGAVVASSFEECTFIQTTREKFPLDGDCLCFKEEHSHAVEQKLCKQFLDQAFSKTQAVVLVDDEISTGKTLINIVKEIKANFPQTQDKQFVSVSIINRVSEENKNLLLKNGIVCESLLNIDNENYDAVVENYKISSPSCVPNKEADYMLTFVDVPPIQNPRVGVDISCYINDCKKIANVVLEKIGNNLSNLQKILVLGTEECMYPSLIVGKTLSQSFLGAQVFVHATTRSPIGVCSDEEYPIKNGYKIKSFYDNDRQTYIYNAKFYDAVLVITDSNHNISEATNDICQVFCEEGCKNFFILRSQTSV